jgi:hypothetical protein
MKKSVFFLSVLLIILFSVSACNHKKRIESSFCPIIYDDITWTSYGDFNLNAEGRDATAWRIVDECGWHIYNNHTGGYGDTLEVASENEEVVFVWAYNDFYGFDVTSGWYGQTKEGIRMGDHVTLFADAYPYFQFLSGNLAYYRYRNTRVYAYFDDDGFLIRLNVGYYFRVY